MQHLSQWLRSIRELTVSRRALIFWFLISTLSAQARAEEVHRLGYISSSTTAYDSPLLKALREGLKEHGLEEGKNVVIEYGFAQSKEQLPGIAAAFVAKKVDLIVAAGSEGIAAAKNATDKIPIVMTNSGDAVRAGFVASLSHPGGNITGMTQVSPELAGKRLEMMKEVVPNLTKVGILWNPDHPNTPFIFKEASVAAEALGLIPRSVEIREASEIAPGVAKVASEGVEAFLVIRDPFTVRNKMEIVRELNQVRRVAMYETPDFVEAGGIMAYGADFAALFRQSADYVDKILRGANPSELAVQRPTRFNLVINQRVAQDLGITIPSTILAIADTVLE